MKLRTTCQVKPGAIKGLAARVKKRQMALGMTYDELAIDSGCSKSYVWGIANGTTTRPSALKLVAIAEALGTTYEHLAGIRLDGAGHLARQILRLNSLNRIKIEDEIKKLLRNQVSK